MNPNPKSRHCVTGHCVTGAGAQSGTQDTHVIQSPKSIQVNQGQINELPQRQPNFTDIFGRAYEDARDCDGHDQIPFEEYFLWRVVRSLTVFREGLSAKQAFLKASAVLQSWNKHSGKPGDCWEVWFHVPTDEAEVRFLSAWERVRFAPGTSPLESAVARAREKPLEPRGDIMDKRPAIYPKFISLAGWLQVVAGDRSIMIPCREFSRLLGVSAMTISRLRGWAMEDGYLKETKPHEYRSRGGGKATEFRFDISRFKSLKVCAAQGMLSAFEAADLVESQAI